MNDETKQQLQSDTFERLIQHLRERKDVQNIDLKNVIVHSLKIEIPVITIYAIRGLYF